jgi:hypothetical protein
MTEIKKITKIVLIWYMICGFLFVIMYLGLTEMQLSMWIYDDPVTFWSMGITMLVLTIATSIAFFREWEDIDLYWIIMTLWMIGYIIMNILIITVLPVTQTALLNNVMNISILSLNVALGIYCYIIQKR